MLTNFKRSRTQSNLADAKEPFQLCRFSIEHIKACFPEIHESNRVHEKVSSLELDYIQTMSFCSRLMHELKTRNIDRKCLGDFIYLTDEITEETRRGRARFR